VSRIRLAVVALAFLALGAGTASQTRVIGGPHWQLITGTDLSGYVNVSGHGVTFARGEWSP